MTRETTLAELVETLKAKDQTTEVQYVIVKPDGELVAVNVSSQAKAMGKMLKLFGGEDG